MGIGASQSTIGTTKQRLTQTPEMLSQVNICILATGTIQICLAILQDINRH